MSRCNYKKEEYQVKFKQYRKQVEKITKKQPLHQLENFEKRGRNKYHLDHILSISYGFHNGIEPELIGNIFNLRFIPYKSNLQKSDYIEDCSWDVFEYFIKEGK